MPILVENEVTVQPVKRGLWKGLFLSTRPIHWVKNIFVFLPVVFDHQLFTGELLSTIVLFVAFSLAAGVAYLINDVLDRSNDMHHPSKQGRPITRGDVKPGEALALAVALAVLAVAVGTAVNLAVAVVIAGYIALNLAYSFWLKRVLLLDVSVIGLGFVLRVLAGAYAIHYTVSDWILISTFFLAVLVGFSKRRYEIMYDDDEIQFNRGYSPYFLDLLIVFSAVTVMGSYVFYVVSRGPWQNGISILASIVVVFYGVLRYLLLIHRSEERLDHTQLLLTDKPLVSAVLLWIALLLTELYIVNPNITWPDVP